MTDPQRTPRGRKVLLAAALLLTVTTACSGPPKSGGTDAEAYRLSADTPAGQAGLDSFSWAVYAEPPTLDYISAFDYPQNTVLSNVCESLMRWTPQLTLAPGLAEKATNPDPTTWVYDLRPNVHFHDGGVLTADDVVYSLGRQMAPENAAAWAQQFQNVSSITKTGPLQVTVKLTQPDSQFNQYMATAAGVVASRAGVEAAGQDYGTSGSLACTGPFKLGTWTKGQSIELQRFDEYWGSKAKSGKVVFRFLTDPSARVNAMLSGEADGGYLIPTESYERLRTGGVGTLYFGEGLSTVNVNVTNMAGVLGDLRVRKALSLALDRSGFVRTGLGGAGRVTGSLTSQAAWAAAPEQVRKDAFEGLTPTAPDIDRAKALIKEAGATGKSLTVATSPIGQDVSVLATAVQAAGAKIGLDVKLRTIAPNAFTALFTDPKAREGIDLFPETYYDSITDPLDLLANFKTGAYQNYASFSDPAYDGLVQKAVAATDPAERFAVTAKLQRTAAEQLLWIPVAEWPTAVFLNKRITGAPTTISYLYYPWAADVGAAR
ncbi:MULTISPECIES: ABC transporter substrate-binding protein [unclassified Kitasatospora]|uniref:ABC transporter substrate-binding protein n=1 Tax=unclassified Kitasatospora TaxID=2633591 RepID=UPI0007091B9E|nr:MULTISPECIES: ABC transporter substrate-binding protein [unclassified Kitasatospora]KQV21667.1 peptide ABC transporter substrate-binding protein [Kitasatospora sp. Root107]KRB77484.1 peptide ABC transporter substrate-binding protein [Kitasatospora sp. Root187]